MRDGGRLVRARLRLRDSIPYIHYFGRKKQNSIFDISSKISTHEPITHTKWESDTRARTECSRRNLIRLTFPETRLQMFEVICMVSFMRSFLLPVIEKNKTKSF